MEAWHSRENWRRQHTRQPAAKIPVQLYGDFCQNVISRKLGGVNPQMRGEWAFGDVRSILPESLNLALMEAMDGFGHMIRGFDRPDAVFAGIESRTSSPVRIWRDEQFESELRGLYPCGEGRRLCGRHYFCGDGRREGGGGHCKTFQIR